MNVAYDQTYLQKDFS